MSLLLFVTASESDIFGQVKESTSLDRLYFKKGDAFLQIGAWDSAIGNYEKVVELNPMWARAYQKLGYSYFKKQIYGKAISAFTKAIELEPDDFESYTYRGTSYYKIGLFQQGESDLIASIRMNPKFPYSYYCLGSLYFVWRKLEEAVTEFDRFVELGAPFSPRYVVYSKRGKAHFWNGDYYKAISDFTKAMELRGEYASGCYYRGLAYSQLDSTDQALSDYSNALRISPQYPQVYYKRAELFILKGDTARAASDLERCVALSRDTELRDRAEERLERMGRAPQ